MHRVIIVAILLAGTNLLFAGDRNPFFAMDTALRDGKPRSAAEQAALLKELGYDGLGANGYNGYPSNELFAAFEKVGLKVFTTYLMLTFDSAKPVLDPALKEFVPQLKGHDTALWIAIPSVTQDGKKLRASDPAGDELVVPLMRELADVAQSNGVRIAFYPHKWFWIERVEDALRVAGKVARTNVGATFNLCHWLAVEGDRDPRPALTNALSKLFFVTINGADTDDLEKLDWSKIIQPLDAGNYDVAGLVKSLRGMGYQSPIGFQGYSIKGDSREILRRSYAGWKKLR